MHIGINATAAAVLHPLCTLVTMRYSKFNVRKAVISFVVSLAKEALTEKPKTSFIRLYTCVTGSS